MKNKQIARVMLALLLCSYGGVVQAADKVLIDGTNSNELINVTGTGNRIVAKDGTTHIGYRDGNDNGGMLQVSNGAAMVFEAGSTVTLNEGTQIPRAIHILGSGSTGTFSGILNINDGSTYNPRAIHVNGNLTGAITEANFTAGSVTTITDTTGAANGSKFGLVASNGTINIAGKVTSTYDGNNSAPVLIGFTTVGVAAWTNSYVNVLNGGELNALSNTGEVRAIRLERGGHLTSEAGSTITAITKGTQTASSAIYVGNNSTVDTLGNVILDATNNAIYLENTNDLHYLNIDGATHNQKVQITGNITNIVNQVGSEGSYISVAFGNS